MRDIEAFAHSTADKLRSEESILREDERNILMGLMTIKRNDERRNLRKLKKEQEEIRRWILRTFGKRKYYDICVKTIRRETVIRRSDLREKYRKKLEHLTEIRRKELERKERECIPKEIGFYRECIIFDSQRMSVLEKMIVEGKCIGKHTRVEGLRL